jgi:predicted tellurium resistance membrane protein TerC
MHWITDPQAWIALLTLTVLELVLGIDNIVFISILSGKLPVDQRKRARRVGLLLAMLSRLALLGSIAWLSTLTQSLFAVLGNEISARDLILIVGGLFLIGKSAFEIHDKLEGAEHDRGGRAAPSFGSVIFQILVLDAVFSLDSVITAVGMVDPDQVVVMGTAIVIAVLFMVFFANPLGDFVERHPTIKILALSFLLLIGTTLVADGLDHHFPRGYIYFAMGFSIMVELLNLRMRAKGAPVKLHQSIEAKPPGPP